jgi:hypothetical protein
MRKTRRHRLKNNERLHSRSARSGSALILSLLQMTTFNKQNRNVYDK